MCFRRVVDVLSKLDYVFVGGSPHVVVGSQEWSCDLHMRF